MAESAEEDIKIGGTESRDRVWVRGKPHYQNHEGNHGIGDQFAQDLVGTSAHKEAAVGKVFKKTGNAAEIFSYETPTPHDHL